MFDVDARQVPAQGSPHLDTDALRQLAELHLVDRHVVDVIVQVEKIPRSRYLLLLGTIDDGGSLLKLLVEGWRVVDNVPEVGDDSLGALEGALLGAVMHLRR